jgi:hypothetical protein
VPYEFFPDVIYLVAGLSFTGMVTGRGFYNVGFMIRAAVVTHGQLPLRQLAIPP